MSPTQLKSYANRELSLLELLLTFTEMLSGSRKPKETKQ